MAALFRWLLLLTRSVTATEWNGKNPLILDPTAGEMSKDMKAVCRSFESVTGWRVPVVERAGLAMRSIAKAEPLKEKGCKRDDCFPCTTGGGNCERNGAGYKISCSTCLRAGRKSEYEGETGANGFTRGSEQAAGLRSKDPENALWKHCTKVKKQNSL